MPHQLSILHRRGVERRLNEESLRMERSQGQGRAEMCVGFGRVTAEEARGLEIVGGEESVGGAVQVAWVQLRRALREGEENGAIGQLPQAPSSFEDPAPSSRNREDLRDVFRPDSSQELRAQVLGLVDGSAQLRQGLEGFPPMAAASLEQAGGFLSGEFESGRELIEETAVIEMALAFAFSALSMS